MVVWFSVHHFSYLFCLSFTFVFFASSSYGYSYLFSSSFLIMCLLGYLLVGFSDRASAAKRSEAAAAPSFPSYLMARWMVDGWLDG